MADGDMWGRLDRAAAKAAQRMDYAKRVLGNAEGAAYHRGRRDAYLAARRWLEDEGEPGREE